MLDNFGQYFVGQYFSFTVDEEIYKQFTDDSISRLLLCFSDFVYYYYKNRELASIEYFKHVLVPDMFELLFDVNIIQGTINAIDKNTTKFIESMR